MERNCPYCPEVLKSERAYNKHLALSHESIMEGEIRMESIKSLEKMRDQVRFLLIKIPASRSSDKILYESLLRYFYPDFMYYDPNDKRLKPTRGGWTFEEYIRMPSYETARRGRQIVQEKALKNIRAGIGTELDKLVLPSDRVAFQREIKEKAYRYYLARG